jgi:hypothetical protein
VRSTAAPYTESRLTHLVRNKCVGFPVVEHLQKLTKLNAYFRISITVRSSNRNRLVFLSRLSYYRTALFYMFTTIYSLYFVNTFSTTGVGGGGLRGAGRGRGVEGKEEGLLCRKRNGSIRFTASPGGGWKAAGKKNAPCPKR